MERCRVFLVPKPQVGVGRGAEGGEHLSDKKTFSVLDESLIQEGQVALKRSPEFCLKLTYRYL